MATALSYVCLCPCHLQETDSGGARGGAAAGQPSDDAASAGSLPEDSEPAFAAGPPVPAQLLPVRATELTAMG